VTAHLLNLEGLAVTSCDNQPPVCDPYVTHRRDQVWVPRVIMVDESHRLHQYRKKEDSLLPESQSALQTAMSSTWSGTVQKVDLDTFSFDAFTSASTEKDVVTNFSWNSNDVMPHSQQPAWLSSWQQAADQLAYAPYSPYRFPKQPDHQKQQQQQQSNRHFSWDDMGDEPEQDEEDMKALRERQEHEQLRQWEGERQRHEENMSNLWKPHPQIAEPEGIATAGKALTSSVPTEADLAQLSWMDYWMPPHPNPISQCIFGLPSASVASSPALHAFNITSNSGGKGLLDDLWDKIRLELERIDACQGFTILTEGSSIYAGMADWLLEEIQQECRAAGRWVFHVAEEDDYETSLLDDQENAAPRTTELAVAQSRLRNSIQRGLSMAALPDHAHVLVPLILPPHRRSLFQSSAELAMALETATLPYRCQSGSNKTLVGWNSMQGYEQGSSPIGMTMGDYLTTLQPSARYSLIELDSVLATENRNRLGQALVEGTSVERDPRMRRPPSSVTAEYPGSWLLDEHFGSHPVTVSPGILTSLSPGHDSKHDRSVHHHFGMSTCLRRNRVSGTPLLNDDNQQYLTCIMEGMGIRYRPETAFGLVTGQSLTQLTSYHGAGSYWQYLLGSGVEIPVLSVLGNTTRMYPHLHSVASGMKVALKSSETKGYYQREVTNGTLPEVDDCDEALERCWDLRDIYEPPRGSGLAEGEDDHYLDE
jgi:hypothetical protein